MMLNAQSEKKKLNNEIGTDITSLIEQVLNFNQNEFYYPYSATYHITYKRLLNKFNLRFGIGGISSSDSDGEDSSLRINYRFGVEKAIDLGKRWNFYYGVDFIHNLTNNRNEVHFQNGGWQQGSERKNSVMGFSPLFGIEFKLSNRVALQTEANFVAYFSKVSNQPIITQISNNPSIGMPSTELETNKSHGTGFNVPNFLVLRIRI